MFSGTLIFAGGGTGGHLFPGLAIAAALRERAPASVRARFICSDRPLDAEILHKEGVEFVPLAARPLSLRPRDLVRFLNSWGRCVRESRKVIRSAAPHQVRSRPAGGGGIVVVAMGGYVAAPVVQAARAERIPIVLVNLDAIPGKANRWIARHARRSARAIAPGRPIAFTSARIERGTPADWKLVPPIVRRQAIASAATPECRRLLGLDPNRRTLVVTGGSQGARSINAFLAALLEREPRAFAAWQVLHQCGRNEADPLRAAYQRAGVPALVVEFSDHMADWWGAADLALCRAGAGNVAEVWANRVPAIFLPYPYHRDQHQRYNAAVLAESGGAVIATDLVSPQRNAARVGPILIDLMSNPARLDAMRRALERLGPASGAEQIAEALLEHL
jgi:UDP-N-acetylglucosamine--N-acetylmuramyl-(pentapeptide) pyrophosphoryl-undecaprenol N-acetylglucosamine transferase